METIVMIHGMWVGAWCFEKYIRFFEQRGYKVLAPSLLYHDVDPSAPPPPQLGATSLQDYADQLEKTIRALPEPPIILGHSMGGLLAQILAERGLGKVIIALTSAPPAGLFALRWTVIKTFSEGLTTWAFWRKPFIPSYEKTVFGMLHLTPEEDQREYYKKMVHESGWASTQLGFWLFDSSRGSHIDESKVTQPMLVIGAGQDRITPTAVVRQVAAKYPQAEYHEFPDMAHNVIGEPGWEDVAQHVHDWLKRKGF